MPNWFAIYTKPHQETCALQQLERQGFSVYLPMTRVRRRRGRRTVLREEPLFPRYLFLYADLERDNTASVRSTLGVVGFVRFGEYIPRVPDGLIKFLRANEKGRLTPKPRFQQGERVVITEGSLIGIEGILEADRKERVIVLLELLGRQNRVQLHADQILPADLAWQS